MTSRVLNKKKNESGFTLMEIIVALIIGLLAISMILSIFTVGLKRIQTIKNTEILHANANFLLNTLTYWVKQGQNLTVDSSRLEIELPDSSVKIITKTSNGKITLDSVPFTSDNIQVTELNFVKMSHSVQIGFTMKAGNETFSATTTIAQRN